MSRLRLMLAATAALAALAIAGCKIDTINSFPVKPASVRVINFVADAPSIDVKKGSDTPFPGVEFATISGYVQFDNNQTTFDVFAPGISDSIASATASLSANEPYTLVGFGVTDKTTTLFQNDSYQTVSAGNSQLRIMDAAYGAGGLDVYFTPPLTDLSTVSPQFTMGLGGSTAYQRIDSGTARLRILRNSLGVGIYDSGPITLPDQASQAYYIYTTGAIHALNVLKVDSITGTPEALPNALAAVKIINAAYQAGAVDQKWDGVPGYSNLPYPGASATYYTLPVGTHLITFESHAAPGAVIASANETFDASTDNTILISGANGSQVISVFADNNIAPQAGTARLRFIAASADTGPVDFVVDGDVKAANIAYTQASGYFNISDSNHRIEIRVAGTTTSLLTVDSQSFGSGQVSTFYLMGPAGALVKLVTPDSV